MDQDRDGTISVDDLREVYNSLGNTKKRALNSYPIEKKNLICSSLYPTLYPTLNPTLLPPYPTLKYQFITTPHIRYLFNPV